MKLWKNWGRLFLTFLCLGPIWCSGESQKQMENLLEKSIDFTAKTTFTSSNPKQNSRQPLDAIVFGADGKVRFEYIGKIRKRKHIIISDLESKSESLWVEDENGTVPPTVIVSEMPGVWNWFFTVTAMLQKDRAKQAVYSLADGEYNGVPCYKLVAQYPADDTAISTAPGWHFSAVKVERFSDRDSTFRSRNLCPGEFKEAPDLFRNNYFASIELLIDKNPEQPFIYAFKADNPAGAEVAMAAWGNVRLLDQLPEDKMVQPKIATVVKVANKKQLDQEYVKAYLPDYHHPKMLFPQLAEYFWSGPGGRLHLGVLTAVLAVFAGLVTFAIRKKCQA